MRARLPRPWIPPRGAGLAVLVLATAVAAWPWVVDSRLSFLQRDTAFNLVALVHLQDVLLHGADWRASPLGWPVTDSVALTDWMAGQALLGLPLRLAGVGATRMHDLLVFMGLAGTAWTVHRLAQALTGRGAHTWLAGVVGGLGPVQMGHAQHVNLVHHEVAVGGGLLVGAGLAGRRPGLAFAGGLLVGAGGQWGAYLGMQAAVVAAVVLVGAAVARRGDARTWGLGAVGGLVGAATLLPVARVYSGFAQLHELAFNPSDLRLESWDVARTLAPVSLAPLHALLASPLPGGPPVAVAHEAPNPGYLALILAFVGLWARPAGPRWAWRTLLGVVGVAGVLALGPEVRWNGLDTGIPTPVAWLGPSILRSPGRWLAIVHIGVAVLAAAGLRGVLARAGRGAPVALGVTLLVALGEVPRAEVGDLVRVMPEPAEAALDAPGLTGALFESVGPGCGIAERKLHTALFTGLPLVGGQYARSFPAIAAVNRIAGAWPAPEARAFFELIGVGVTFEHPPLRPLPPGSADGQGLDCVLIDGHRRCVLAPSARAPLPDPASVQTAADGPVVGLRWANAALPVGPLTLRCGEAEEATYSGIWMALAQVRGGARAEFVDVFLASPCMSLPTASAPGGAPLYAPAARPWLPPVAGPRGSVAGHRLP